MLLRTGLQELLPGIIDQLGTDNLQNLKQLVETQAPGGGFNADAGGDDEDEDVPDLTETNFEGMLIVLSGSRCLSGALAADVSQ